MDRRHARASPTLPTNEAAAERARIIAYLRAMARENATIDGPAYGTLLLETAADLIAAEAHRHGRRAAAGHTTSARVCRPI